MFIFHSKLNYIVASPFLPSIMTCLLQWSYNNKPIFISLLNFFQPLYRWCHQEFPTTTFQTTWFCLPVLLHLKENFPAVLIIHFSLFSIYIRTLRYFESWHHIMSMIYFIQAYLNQFESFDTRCAEYLSTHTLIHRYDQCFDHGSSSSHSMFSKESYLHHT